MFTLGIMRKGTHVISAWLWDLSPVRRPALVNRSASSPRKAQQRDQSQYQRLVTAMKQRHHIRIRRWRKTSSGCAWQVMYTDGTVSRLIEAPLPRGPVSAAVFLHEVGHHAIGFHRYKLRCLEEYMAWDWALATMRRHRIEITPQVERLVHRSLRYAVAKALRRGLKIDKLPTPLHPYAKSA
jgi:hypothetical protein